MEIWCVPLHGEWIEHPPMSIVDGPIKPALIDRRINEKQIVWMDESRPRQKIITSLSARTGVPNKEVEMCFLNSK